MKSIFDDNNSIQVNPAWEYNETDHKWTIDENDVIIHTELSEEIYSDFYKLDQYNLVLEEACEAYNKLTDQIISNNNILDNHKITVEHISLSNECLSICKAQLGYDITVNRSHESDMTNYERLVVSNEGIIDFIKELIIKIKELFKKVWNFFKNLFIKILRWLGLWEDKLDKMHKEVNKALNNVSNEDLLNDYQNALHDARVRFNNIGNVNDMVISAEAITKILNLFPISLMALKELERPSFIDLFKLINFKDILSPVTDKIDTTLKNIKDGKLSNLNTSEFTKKIIKIINKDLEKEKLSVLLVTRLTDRQVWYIDYHTEDNKINNYNTYTIPIEDFEFDVNYLTKLEKTINKKTIEEMFDYVMNTYVPLFHLQEQKIKRLHRVLDNYINEIDKSIDKSDNETLKNNKENLQIIKNMGSSVPLDIIKFMQNMTSRYIDMLSIIHKDLIDNNENTNIYSVIEKIAVTNTGTPNEFYKNIKVKYLNGRKELPYLVLSRELWHSLIKHGKTGIAFAIIEDAMINNINLKGTIVIDEDFINGKSGYRFKDISKSKYGDIVNESYYELIHVYSSLYDRLITPNLNRIWDIIKPRPAWPEGYPKAIEVFKSRDNLKNFDYLINSDVKKYKDIDSYCNDILIKLEEHIKNICMLAAECGKIESKFDHELVYNSKLIFPQILLSIKAYFNYDDFPNDITIIRRPLSPKERTFIYYHEMGHIIMKQPENPMYSSTMSMAVEDQYVKGFTENQADAYAMIKTHMSVSDVALLRCCTLMPQIAHRILEYIPNLLKATDDVLKWETVNNRDRAIHKLLKEKNKVKYSKNDILNKMTQSAQKHLTTKQSALQSVLKRYYITNVKGHDDRNDKIV